MSTCFQRLQLLIAAICLVAQGLAAGHHVLVEHTRCAEHGEMVHASEHAAHATSGAEHSAARSQALVSDVDAMSSAEGAHVDDHEHCVATSDRRKALLCVPAIVEAAPVIALRVTVDVVQQAPRSQARYWIAPKTSPPT